MQLFLTDHIVGDLGNKIKTKQLYGFVDLWTWSTIGHYKICDLHIGHYLKVVYFTMTSK